jgi:hypothetical protein
MLCCNLVNEAVSVELFLALQIFRIAERDSDNFDPAYVQVPGTIVPTNKHVNHTKNIIRSCAYNNQLHSNSFNENGD